MLADEEPAEGSRSASEAARNAAFTVVDLNIRRPPTFLPAIGGALRQVLHVPNSVFCTIERTTISRGIDLGQEVALAACGVQCGVCIIRAACRRFCARCVPAATRAAWLKR